jgi:probable HAF family extracellular repeat protein
MIALRRLRNFWILGVAAMVLVCFSNAVAQAKYKVEDLGVQHPDNLGMPMGLNNYGWTLNMEQFLDPFSLSTEFPAVSGTDSITINHLNLELGTLGGANSSINWNGINDPGEAVGMSETSALDPNGEDICGFGTHHICLPFVWKNGVMTALPTVGGVNGQASAINNKGQVAGYAENGMVDSTCMQGPNNRVDLPVMWTKGIAQPLPPFGKDPDGVAYGINNLGQTVGYSGTCIAVNSAVMWQNNMVTQLPGLGILPAIAYEINDRGQIVGQGVTTDGVALATLWENNTVTALGGGELPEGDVSSFATSINNRGEAVGSSLNSDYSSWSHGLLWQNGVMYDLNTLFPASSHLFVVNASNINDSGQIAGMALETVGPHAYQIVHGFLATPVKEDMGKTVAEVVLTHPKITLPAAHVGKQLSLRSAHRTIHDQGIF